LAAAGFIHEDERFELLGGEIVPMSPKGNRHEILREELSFKFAQSAPRGVFVSCEPQFNLTQDTYTAPDILVPPAAIKTPKLRASEALLVVEVADISLEYDLRTKVPLYATHGVREYWVINAVTLMTTVHRQPAGNAYAFTEEVPGEALLVPSLVPVLTVSLRTLDLD
jgi:Uma2 family endonuclease